MLRRTLALLAALPLGLAAQQPAADPARVMERLGKQAAPLAVEWLRSSDPRTQAWGAYLALRDGHREAIPDLLVMAAAFPGEAADADQRDAMLAVLDALIQFGAQVPVGDAQRIYPLFPVQSLILLSSAQDESSSALLAIFKSELRWPAAWLAAGDMLVERRAEGFAAAVVEGMTVQAQVSVVEPGTGGGSGGSAFCGFAAPPGPAREGWPPAGVYAFDGCGGGRLQAGATVLAGGTDAVYYRRQVNSSYGLAGRSSCNPDPNLVRQHFLTELLFASPDDPPVRAYVSRTIVWRGSEAYAGEMAAFIGEQQQVFAELARRLAKAGLLSAEDATTLLPALSIRVLDQRAGGTPPLPVIHTVSNVSIERF